MKQKNQLAVLAVLLVIAAVVWYFYFHRQNPAATPGTVLIAQNIPLLSVENPQLHTDRLKLVQKTEYKGTGRDIFSAIAAPPPSRPPQKMDPKPQPVGPQVEPPPPPPALPPNVKFFGYGTVPNGTSRLAFFTDGEDVYVVSEGEVFLNRFRILKVGNASLEFEEVSSGRHGTATLEEQGTGPSA